MHYDEERLEELEKQYAKMGETIKQMKEKKKWEPEGGDCWVDVNGCVHECRSEDRTRVFGTERQTHEQAEKARDKMRVFNRLLAYVDEFAPDYEFVEGGDNFCVRLYREYELQLDSHWPRIGAVYMPNQTAIELCKKLNSGEVVL